MSQDRIKCFYVEATTLSRRWLRRLSWMASKEDPNHYHDARIYHSDVEETDAIVTLWNSRNDVPAEWKDCAWPIECECGYVFTENDPYQVFKRQLYKRIDNGELMTLEDAPVGAMWNSQWPEGWKGYTAGEDGIILTVKTPGGEWVVDGPESGKQVVGWRREGVAASVEPTVTVMSSIVIGVITGSQNQYHGWLRNGYLEKV